MRRYEYFSLILIVDGRRYHIQDARETSRNLATQQWHPVLLVTGSKEADACCWMWTEMYVNCYIPPFLNPASPLAGKIPSCQEERKLRSEIHKSYTYKTASDQRSGYRLSIEMLLASSSSIEVHLASGLSYEMLLASGSSSEVHLASGFY